jgi:hypothetical protein
MLIDGGFQAAYRALEERMKALAEADGNVFLPNPEPLGPVDYVLICMEPSLGRWARPADQATSTIDEARLKEAKSKVEAGFRNFLSSIDAFILHFCVRRYLCESDPPRYHITDLSKGAMLVKEAPNERIKRYERWYPWLKKELDLCATAGARIVAVGKVVYQYLQAQPDFRRDFNQVIHYSSQAGSARRRGIVGREDSFQAFMGSVSLEDLVATAEATLKAARVPSEICEKELRKLRESQLTTSRLRLIFNYKVAFESMRSLRPSCTKCESEDAIR